jgi:hypothetical protein
MMTPLFSHARITYLNQEEREVKRQSKSKQTHPKENRTRNSPRTHHLVTLPFLTITSAKA